MASSEIIHIVNQGLEEMAMSHIFLIDVLIVGKKIEVFLDSDSELTFEECKKLSRYIEASLDSSKKYGEDYILEVSSAGVGSPLKFPRQYVKNIGRVIEVKYGDKEKVRGKIESADANFVTVVYEEKIKEGKKNKKVISKKEIAYDTILESKIKISFS